MKTTAIILLLFVATLTLQEENPCKLPYETGPCEASITKYYYDWDSKQCLEFTYGGCEGNANNFESADECYEACPGEEPKEEPQEEPKEQPEEEPKEQPEEEPKEEPQEEPKEEPEEEPQEEPKEEPQEEPQEEPKEEPQEEPKEEPEEKPKEEPSVENPCELPSDKGPCKASLRKWFFDTSRKVCRMFLYGGCDGNANRFDTKEDCRKRCVATMPASVICRLPYAMGSCSSNIRRFFYDFETKQCRAFTYTGCEGNANNFATEHACHKKCSSVQ